MRQIVAAMVCAIAVLSGCQTPKEEPPKDPKLQAREMYLNSMAARHEQNAADLRQQAAALEMKAKNEELKAKQLRQKAKAAGQGKLVEPDENTEH